MGIDRPDDDDTPDAAKGPDDVADSGLGAREADAPGVRPGPDRADDAERIAYAAEYRAKVEAVYLGAAHERWDAAKPGLEAEWREYARQHPAPPDASIDIDGETCAQVERGCKEIRETEENIVTPAMIRIEAEDPERQLVGLEFRCKGEDRITEKVAAALEEQANLTPADALASVKDAIRYTFQYTEHHYAEGVGADVGRLKEAGFELVELRNSWRFEEYKGINSRWRVPDSGQLFEVQFHTAISFEAKQLTHEAYERIRSPTTPHAELRELRAFQREVNAEVPHPPHVMDVPEYP
jgi:hypothetical protein